MLTPPFTHLRTIPTSPLKANGVGGGAFDQSYSQNFDSMVYGVGVAAVVVSEDSGCER